MMGAVIGTYDDVESKAPTTKSEHRQDTSHQALMATDRGIKLVGELYKNSLTEDEGSWKQNHMRVLAEIDKTPSVFGYLSLATASESRRLVHTEKGEPPAFLELSLQPKQIHMALQYIQRRIEAGALPPYFADNVIISLSSLDVKTNKKGINRLLLWALRHADATPQAKAYLNATQIIE